jgi:hypothetical protein
MTPSTQRLCIGARMSGELVMLDPEERRRHPLTHLMAELLAPDFDQPFSGLPSEL